MKYHPMRSKDNAFNIFSRHEYQSSPLWIYLSNLPVIIGLDKRISDDILRAVFENAKIVDYSGYASSFALRTRQDVIRKIEEGHVPDFDFNSIFFGIHDDAYGLIDHVDSGEYLLNGRLFTPYDSPYTGIPLGMLVDDLQGMSIGDFYDMDDVFPAYESHDILTCQIPLYVELCGLYRGTIFHGNEIYSVPLSSTRVAGIPVYLEVPELRGFQSGYGRGDILHYTCKVRRMNDVLESTVRDYGMVDISVHKGEVR